MASTIPSLQLPVFTPLEPLTKGTDLPVVPTSELTPPEPYYHERASNSGGTDNLTQNGLHDGKDNSMSPPASPGRPASVRRFLSRVSLNSSYTSGGADDKSSIFSSPTSITSSDNKKKSKVGKTSWWKKVRRQSAILPSSSESIRGGSTHKSEPVVQSIPPPPRLPDDMFGSNLSSLDGDMFKNLK